MDRSKGIHRFAGLSASCAALAVSAIGLSSCARDERPNFLIFLADDYGGMDTGVNGSTFYETPHIDSIAEEGILFTNGYAACTVSSPSRASLMTGLYPTRHGITEWIGEESGEGWRKHGWCTRMLPASYEHNLDVDRFKCLPQILKDNGYSTFMAGKWHLGDDTTPEMAGFDINVGGYGIGQPPGGYFSPYNNPKLPDGPDGEELCMRLAQETNRFLEGQKRKKGRQPFFAYLSFYAVHTPVQTTEAYWRHFRDKAVSMPPADREPFRLDRHFTVCQVQDNPVFAGLVKQMDDAVGVVLAKLKELHYDRNTIVIFMSDNGGLSSLGFYSTSNYPFRGGKSYQWEGGIRVPFFIHVPGTRLRHTSNDTPVNTIDIYPTLLDYAGITDRPELDGVSLRPLLEGGSIGERPMFWHYPHYGGSGGDPSSIIRRGDWKLIYYHEDGHCELYNLSEDIGEQQDVLPDNRELAASLLSELQSWLEETGARMPVPDPLYSESEHRKVFDRLRENVLRQQLSNRAMRLRDDWSPGRDWWGSHPVVD